jgi:poly-gamma-glutamate synthesis protein (capsule biosynthesis protein)
LATTTVNGVRIALVGFNTTDNALDEMAASSTLTLARQESDKVIVFMHWGLEYRHMPPDIVREQAHWLIDHGADIVIGGHPHWVQGVEKYEGKPIVYSLGNFIFDQYFSKETQQGLAVVLTLNKEGTQLDLIPLRSEQSQPFLAEGAKKSRPRRVHLFLNT